MTIPSGDGRSKYDARLLVVEDEPNILELLSASLRYAGFEVVTAAAGGEAVQAAQRPPARPDRARRHAARHGRLRRDPAAARRRRPYPGRLPDRPGRHRGQDPRPDPGRRRLRDQAVQPGGGHRPDPGRAAPDPRRRRRADAAAEVRRPRTRRGQPRGVAGRAGQVQLSPTEFKLLRYFMGNANRVLSKMQILDHVWDYDFRGDTGIVESYVSVLRRKVDTSGAAADPHPARRRVRAPASVPVARLMSVQSGLSSRWQEIRRRYPDGSRCGSS